MLGVHYDITDSIVLGVHYDITVLWINTLASNSGYQV